MFLDLSLQLEFRKYWFIPFSKKAYALVNFSPQLFSMCFHLNSKAPYEFLEGNPDPSQIGLRYGV